MNNTKLRILHSAISLFNQQGIHNVRLQQIADHCNISIGNLAYHFQRKEHLLEFVAQYISDETNSLLAKRTDLLYMIDFDNQLALYYDIINKYAFYFHDVIELQERYKHIHARRVVHIDRMIRQIHSWLIANEQTSILTDELHEGQYRRLANTIWMVIIFWKTQKKIRSANEGYEEEFKLAVWDIIIPHFTDSGKLEFEVLIQPRLHVIQDQTSSN